MKMTMKMAVEKKKRSVVKGMARQSRYFKAKIR
jgi:hypothetical protein